MEEGLETGSDVAEESLSSAGGSPARWDWQATHHVAIYSHTSLAAALEATMAEVDHGDRRHGDYTQPLNEEPPMEVRSLDYAQQQKKPYSPWQYSVVIKGACLDLWSRQS